VCNGSTLVVSWANAIDLSDWSSAFAGGVSITVNGSSSSFADPNGSSTYSGGGTFSVTVVYNNNGTTMLETTLTCSAPVVPPPPPAPITEEIVCLDAPEYTVIRDEGNCPTTNPIGEGDEESIIPTFTLPTDFFMTVNVSTQVINGVTTLVVTDIDGNTLGVYGVDDLNTDESTHLTSEAGASNGNNQVCIDETITEKNRYTGQEETIRRRLCITSFDPLVFTIYTYTADNLNR
jgi:hypothetical protein